MVIVSIFFQAVDNPTYTEIKDVLAAAGLYIGVEVKFSYCGIILFTETSCSVKSHSATKVLGLIIKAEPVNCSNCR